MEILNQITDWIKIIGSMASVGLAIYFVYHTISTKRLAKKPLRDAKKREKAKQEIARLIKDYGLADLTKEEQNDAKKKN